MLGNCFFAPPPGRGWWGLRVKRYGGCGVIVPCFGGDCAAGAVPVKRDSARLACFGAQFPRQRADRPVAAPFRRAKGGNGWPGGAPTGLSSLVRRERIAVQHQDVAVVEREFRRPPSRIVRAGVPLWRAGFGPGLARLRAVTEVLGMWSVPLYFTTGTSVLPATLGAVIIDLEGATVTKENA